MSNLDKMSPPIFKTKEEIYNTKMFSEFVKLEFEPKPFWKRIFCIHYFVEIERKFYGIIYGTKVVWGCGKCGKKIKKDLLDIPFNPLPEWDNKYYKPFN